MKLSHSFDRIAPNYVRSEPALGPAKRAKSNHLAMGGDSDDEIEEEETEDLEAVELDEDISSIDLTPPEAFIEVDETEH